MVLLKRIKLTIRMWFELREFGYTLRDCWGEAQEILDRTESFKRRLFDEEK